MRRCVATWRAYGSSRTRSRKSRLRGCATGTGGPAERTACNDPPPARVTGVGIETADMLVNEILARNLRDQKAVARYAGLTGSPDESGKRSREKGLSRAGNARVRRGMIQLAWRFLICQKESALAQWYRVAKGCSQRHPQDHDRRIGAKASHSAVAYGDDWRDAGRSDVRPSAKRRERMKSLGVRSRTTEIVDCRSSSEVAVTRYQAWLAPLRSLGPPPRNFAPMRIAASWSGSHGSAEYKHASAIIRA